MTTGIVQDQNLEKHIEKQMGCMAGFLQIFDRHQILAGKRVYSTKRLPPSVLAQTVDTVLESESTIGSPAISTELEKQQRTRSTASPERLKQSPTMTEPRSPVPESPIVPQETQPKSPLPLPVFEFKEGTRSSWKFSREAPRLSLDSRATIDAKGSLYPKEIRTNAAILSANRYENSAAEGDDNDKQRRSPSVIARLMGLEPLPHSDPEPVKNAELRRSASESRVSKDLYQYRFIDGNTFQLKQSQQANISSNVIRDNAANEVRAYNARPVDPKGYVVRDGKAEPPKLQHKGMGQRKSFFNSADFFPEPKHTVSVYGEIEKRLKMRGIDEPSKDLETRKQILEAQQLKGLLHSSKKPSNLNYRNFVYDRNFSHDEYPIVLMKPSRSAVPMSRPSRMVGSDFPPPSSYGSRPSNRRNHNLFGETSPAVSPRRDRTEIDRNVRYQCRGRNSSPPPNRVENSTKSPNRRRPLNVERQQRKTNNNDFVDQRRISPVSSPKVNSRRIISDQQTSSNRSPRNRKRTTEVCPKEEKVFPQAEDESSTMSESSISTSSQTDTERYKVEEYKEGRSLLERCDKLLHSIAEITATELQPSPVSVLDSSFYKDESLPSPVLKRSIDFKDQPVEFEDEIWIPAISPVEAKFNDSDDCDLVYIREILRVSNYLPEDSDVFQLLEKQQYLKGKDTSKASRLRRRLIFDTINEIQSRNRQLPPWKTVCWTNYSTADQNSVRQIWLEFRKIRERDESEDLFEVICGVLRKDLAGDAIHGWEDCPIEMSESVLDIERLIFKDLIGETIRELAFSAAKFNKPSAPCRKLVF